RLRTERLAQRGRGAGAVVDAGLPRRAPVGGGRGRQARDARLPAHRRTARLRAPGPLHRSRRTARAAGRGAPARGAGPRTRRGDGARHPAARLLSTLLAKLLALALTE